MQGVVDIKDNSVIVRFKFMARPKNPTIVQRMVIRRMYEQFPALGIRVRHGQYLPRSAAGDAPCRLKPPNLLSIGTPRPLPRRPKPPNRFSEELPHAKAQTRQIRSRIPPIAFGGNVFGWTADEATSHKLLDGFVDAGFSFVDITADVSSRWVPRQQGWRAETVIGTWLKKDPSKRDKIVLATKCGMGLPSRCAVRQEHQGVGRRLAEAAQHRSHRSLPVAQGRQGHAAGRDALDLR